MGTIAKREKKDKGIRKEGTARDTGIVEWGEVDAKVALIQVLIPLGLKAVAEALKVEVPLQIYRRLQEPQGMDRGCYAVCRWG